MDVGKGVRPDEYLESAFPACTYNARKVILIILIVIIIAVTMETREN